MMAPFQQTARIGRDVSVQATVRSTRVSGQIDGVEERRGDIGEVEERLGIGRRREAGRLYDGVMGGLLREVLAEVGEGRLLLLA
eukprot:CAMPEP_0196662814 /NCGR_PEP_ID=MMETSP1086-20130531/50434_1 /TAXON_ID=77921 /ORGANISM="Cyanoptyche  gloeocystis , Strain SAG4.97" /LENGTH=83 /DNA_ID=CAMNT_0041998397 /DNA_START=77 /DNA_END=325 /DNA_ORIENTATION=+